MREDFRRTSDTTFASFFVFQAETSGSSLIIPLAGCQAHGRCHLHVVAVAQGRIRKGVTARRVHAIKTDMDDHALITELGLALWGAAWKEPMADALRQPKGTVSDWAQGRVPVPADVWKDLREVTRLRRLKLADFDQEIVRAYDAAVVRASARRT